MSKIYYWIKVSDDFFKQKEMKKLRRIAGGDTYTIIYLKMLLLAAKQNNKLFFDGIEDTFAEELAIELDEDEENVKMTLSFLMKYKLIEVKSDDEFLLTRCDEVVGSLSDAALRKRRSREKQKKLECDKLLEEPKKPLTNAERQKRYRDKRKQHIPFIEEYTNKINYGGNYYIALERDGMKCQKCGETEDLCMHHLKYGENKLEDLITVCRSCHNKIHSNQTEYSNVTENVTKKSLYIEKEKEIDKDNIYIEQSSKEVEGGLLLQPDTIETKIKDKQPSKSKKDFSLEINEIRSYYKGTKSKKVADNKLPKLIKEYTKDQLIRAIERYNNYVESERKKGFATLKYKNESTWWNGGFIDYLDDEYNAQEQTLFDIIKTSEKALQGQNNSMLNDDIDFNY